MSYYEYEASQDIARCDYPYYALIMAAMRAADSDNAAALRTAFPAVWRELQARYSAPGGVIDGDVLPEDDDSMPSDIGIPDDSEYVEPRTFPPSPAPSSAAPMSSPSPQG